MIKRIEFSLNLEDPQEAIIYRALLPALRYRRAGAVIRQALGNHLIKSQDQQAESNVTQQEHINEQDT